MVKRSDQLKEFLKKREQLHPREVVEPVKFYRGIPQEAKRQEESEQKSNTLNLRRFTSYLTPDSYRKIKIIAINEDKNCIKLYYYF